MNIKKLRGFTLIELMVVVAIIGILASIATSMYGDYIMKSRCTLGRSALLETSTSLGKCQATYGAYNNANCLIATGPTVDGHFTVGLVRDATTFTLTASSFGATNQANTFCTTQTLDNLGVQGGTGSAPW